MSIHTRPILKLLALAACAIAASSAAGAVDNTRYISTTGNDANACTLAAPCLTLQRGIDATPAGGELRIRDSGFYGNNSTVNRSMTISGNGNTVFLGTGITVDDADAVVTLRWFTLNGQGTIADGISINAAAVVHIDRCVIHNFTQHGIYASAGEARVFVTDSVSRDNGGDGLDSTTTSRLTVDNSRFVNNGGRGVSVGSGSVTISRSAASGNGEFGIAAGGSVSVSVVSTLAMQNGIAGFLAGGPFGGIGSTMTVESSVAVGNGDGLIVTDSANARISNSTFTDNGRGILNQNILETRGNNTVRGNTTDVSGAALTAIGDI